jgi:hypothetical protein
MPTGENDWRAKRLGCASLCPVTGLNDLPAITAQGSGHNDCVRAAR